MHVNRFVNLRRSWYSVSTPFATYVLWYSYRSIFATCRSGSPRLALTSLTPHDSAVLESCTAIHQCFGSLDKSPPAIRIGKLNGTQVGLCSEFPVLTLDVCLLQAGRDARGPTAAVCGRSAGGAAASVRGGPGRRHRSGAGQALLPGEVKIKRRALSCRVQARSIHCLCFGVPSC